MKSKLIFFIVLFISAALIAYGASKGDINLVFNFGRFICFDCIGIS